MQRNIAVHNKKDYFFLNGFNTFLEKVRGKGKVKKRNNKLIFNLGLPGIKKRDINIELKDGYLYICINKNQKSEKKKKNNYSYTEQCLNLSKSVYVGKNISPEDVFAKFKRGKLKIYLNKDKIYTKKIEIQ